MSVWKKEGLYFCRWTLYFSLIADRPHLIECIYILAFFFSFFLGVKIHVLTLLASLMTMMMMQVVQETIDPDARIEYRPNTEDDPHKRKPDISRAKDQLGWEPKVDLRKGLPLMVSDFRQRIFGDQKEKATVA